MTIREIKKGNRDEDKILRDLGFIFDSEKDHYEPKKLLMLYIQNEIQNNYIQNESIGDKDKTLTIKEQLYMTRQYLSGIINDHKTHQLKIYLKIAIDFISSKDSDETCTMHAKSDNTEIMMCSETDEIIKELFEPLFQKYQEGLQKSMKGSEFIFDSFDVLSYDLNKISPNRRGSYIDSPEWLKNKKSSNES